MTVRFDHIAQQVPDIAEAVDWWRTLVDESRVLYQDDSWALVEGAGVRMAFVLPEQHPDHVGLRVDAGRLERMAAERGATISPHRDGTRSIYVQGPGSLCVEVITYPEDAGR
jgi:hypothetical protein